MKKNLKLLFIASAIALASVSCKKNASDVTPRENQFVKMAIEYGFDPKSIQGGFSTLPSNQDELNHFFISIKMQGIFNRGFNKQEMQKLAAKIKTGIDDGKIKPNSVLLTFIRNAPKKISSSQMLDVLKRSLNSLPDHSSAKEGSDPVGERELPEVILYSGPNGGYFTSYYWFLNNPDPYMYLPPTDQEAGGGNSGGGGGGNYDPAPPPMQAVVIPEVTELPNGNKQFNVTSRSSMLFCTLNFTFVLTPDGKLLFQNNAFNVTSYMSAIYLGTYSQIDITKVSYTSTNQVLFTINGQFTYNFPGTSQATIVDKYHYDVTYSPSSNTVEIVTRYIY